MQDAKMQTNVKPFWNGRLRKTVFFIFVFLLLSVASGFYFYSPVGDFKTGGICLGLSSILTVLLYLNYDYFSRADIGDDGVPMSVAGAVTGLILEVVFVFYAVLSLINFAGSLGGIAFFADSIFLMASFLMIIAANGFPILFLKLKAVIGN